MPLIFNGGASNVIEASGKESQTIEGSLVLASDNSVNMTFENISSSGSVGITQNGDLLLSSESGDVVVTTPDGENTNAVVNVAYVNNLVGTIETTLESV